MLLIREIMYCKPGKVRPLVEKFLAMNKLGQKIGMPKMRVMTDFCAERYSNTAAARSTRSRAHLRVRLATSAQRYC